MGPVTQSVQRLATGWTVCGSNPGGGEIFHTCPHRPWGPSSLLYNGYRVFLGGKERPGPLTTNPLLMPWSRKSSAIPLLPLWTLRRVQSLSACKRVRFTFYYVGTRVRYPLFLSLFNRLTPNDTYMGRTAPLTSKRFILYIYSTNVGTEYFKHALYSPFLFSSKCSLFHNANLFGSCIIHILYTGCAKI